MVERERMEAAMLDEQSVPLVLEIDISNEIQGLLRLLEIFMEGPEGVRQIQFHPWNMLNSFGMKKK